MSSPVFFATADAFHDWLAEHAAAQPELLVGFHKRHTSRPSMSWSESVDEALCFGWIDGVRKRIDDASYSIRFTPRRPTSIWSAINIAKFELLQTQGRMTAAGVKAYSHRQEHRSAIYSHEQADTAELRPEELAEFERIGPAWSYFLACPPSYKKVVLHWISTAKKPATRASRFDSLLRASAAGQRLR